MSDPLSVSSGVAGILALVGSIVATCYSYGCAVKGAPEEVQKLVEEMLHLAGVLNAVRALVDHGRTPIIPNTSQGSTANGGNLPPVYSLLEPHDHFDEFIKLVKGSEDVLEDVQKALRKAEIQHEKRLGKVIRRLRWPLKRDETMALVNRVERYKSLYMLSLNTTNGAMVVDAQKTLNDIRQTQIAERLERQLASKAAEQRRIYDWLCPVSCVNSHRAARRQHLEGTGRWILDNPSWHVWHDADRSLLWLYGIPGAGKTVMVSTLLEHCEQLTKEDEHPYVAYFYCDFRDKKSQQAEVVLGGLIAQLCTQLDEPPEELRNFSNTHSSPGMARLNATCEELEKLLFAILPHFRRVILVVDALDECSNRSQLLSVLTTLPVLESSAVKVLVSSRQTGDIEAALSSLDPLSIRIDAHLTDIETYVTSCMEASPRLSRLPEELHNTVQTTLVSQAGGMFQWVQCQIESLNRLRTDRDIRRAVGQLPSTLWGAYERILERIEPADMSVARRALAWLAYGPRTLSIAELAEAVVIEDDTTIRDPEATWHATDLLEVIGSLARYSTPQGQIELAHASVKDFLETAPLPAHLSAFHLNRVSARAELATSMLIYLLMSDFNESCDNRPAFERRLGNYPLYHLSARYWPFYARDALASSPTLLQLATTLLAPTPSPHFRSWVEALVAQGPNNYSVLEKYGIDAHPVNAPAFRVRWFAAPMHLRPLYYAASFGLAEVVDHAIKAGANVNERGGLYRGTPLHAAVYRGQVECVRLLLQGGANVNARDENNLRAWMLSHITSAPESRAEISDLLRAAKLAAKTETQTEPKEVPKEKPWWELQDQETDGDETDPIWSELESDGNESRCGEGEWL